MKKIVGSALELSAKGLFSVDKYRLEVKICIENSVFANQHKGNINIFLELTKRWQSVDFSHQKYNF